MKISPIPQLALLFLGFLTLATSTPVEAETPIVQYLMESADPEPVNAVPGIEATSLRAGQLQPLVTGFSKPNNNAFFLLNNSERGAQPLAESKEAALEGYDYFEFTVSPSATQPLNLTGLSLSVGHEGGRTLAIHLFVVADIAGKTHTSDFLFGSLSSYEAIEANSNAAVLPVTAKADLRALPRNIKQDVTFRIYAYYEFLAGTPIPPGYSNSIRIGKISLIGEAVARP